MVALILFHICGIGRAIRSIAWSLLIVGCTYAGFAIIIHTPVQASSHTTVIYDSLNALDVLQYHDSYDHLFDGNNKVVFDVLKQTYKNGDNPASYARFVEAFGSIDINIWKRYAIDKEEVMIVLESIHIVVGRAEINSLLTGIIGGSNTGNIPYEYDIQIIEKENGTLIAFETQNKNLPKRMNWYFGDGSTYSCERMQCKRFNHLYKESGTYTIDVFSALKGQAGEKISFAIDTNNGPRSSTVESSHSAAEEKCVLPATFTINTTEGESDRELYLNIHAVDREGNICEGYRGDARLYVQGHTLRTNTVDLPSNGGVSFTNSASVRLSKPIKLRGHGFYTIVVEDIRNIGVRGETTTTVEEIYTQ